jgi:hypothetical protein
MVIIWFLVGSLMVIGPWLIFHAPMDPWPGTVAAGIGGTAFVVILFLFVILRTLFLPRTKLLSSALLVIMLVASFVSWKTMYDQTHFQRNVLGKIRTFIGEEIIETASYDALYPPLRKYYEQPQPRRLSIGKIFLAVNKQRIHDKAYRFDSDQYIQSSLDAVSDSSVTLIMVDSVARGRNLTFANYNGDMGRLQFKSVLREKGVHYEREN